MFLDVDFVTRAIEEIKYRILYPFNLGDEVACLVSLFLLEFSLSLVNAFFIPSLDYITLWRQLLVKRNEKIHKINEPLAKGQISRELKTSFIACLLVSIITCPLHYILQSGRGKIYLAVTDFSPNHPSLCWLYLLAQILIFFAISDFSIYWIHRALHHKLLYAPLHKLHHSFVYISPYTAFAFNPVDAWFQSLPYWVIPMFIPMHKFTHVALLIGVTIWTILIHDRITLSDWKTINGAGHHYIHHRDFVYNYGQYLTLCDKFFGTYKDPINKKIS